MHLPDGFINGVTSLGAGVAAVGGLGAAVRHTGRYLTERQIPLAGLMAALIFALQMINFPVAAGTSGHLLGGALAAVILGPWLGIVVVSVVVIVQALIFADGGVTALGLNIVNMAVVTTVVGWGTFRVARWLTPKSETGVVAATVVAGIVSVVASAGAFVVEYAVGGSGGAPIGVVAGAMLGVHLLIGIGEGAISAGVVGSVLAARPDLVYGARDLAKDRRRPRIRRLGAFVAAGLAIAVALVVVVAPFADPNPDGLLRVAQDTGIADTATDSPLEGPLTGYGVEGVESGFVGTAVAGTIGVLVILIVAVIAFAWWRHRSTHRPAGRTGRS